MKKNGREQLVEEMSRLDYGSGTDSARLISMIVALAGEVFVMKANNECLRRALIAQGRVDTDALDREATSDAMKAWFAHEEQAFAQAILEPLIAGDKTINVVDEMRRV
jgi:hypothetical protein